MGKVRKVVDMWNPEGCKTEKEYEISLFRLLEEQLPGIEVIRQYGLGRIKADIAVGGKVFIEIKSNIGTRDRLQRLLGQLTLYAKAKVEYFILIIIGHIENNMKAIIENEIEKYNGGLLPIEEDTCIVLYK